MLRVKITGGLIVRFKMRGIGLLEVSMLVAVVLVIAFGLPGVAELSLNVNRSTQTLNVEKVAEGLLDRICSIYESGKRVAAGTYEFTEGGVDYKVEVSRTSEDGVDRVEIKVLPLNGASLNFKRELLLAVKGDKEEKLIDDGSYTVSDGSLEDTDGDSGDSGNSHHRRRRGGSRRRHRPGRWDWCR